MVESSGSVVRSIRSGSGERGPKGPGARLLRLWGFPPKALAALLLWAVLPGCADPVRPPSPEVSRFAVFDSVMTGFMSDHDIKAGALGIMKDGVVVYEEGFGWMDSGSVSPVPDDVMMRLASICKPLTAAVVRELIDDGLLSLDDHAFDLDQPGGGILDLQPFPALGDPRLANITVRHLLQHRGGWDRDVTGDLSFREIEIAQAMGVPSPPGRERTVRYILGQPLQFTPGAEHAYANIGYLVLGLIIEEVTGSDYLSALRSLVLNPLGVPAGELIQGRTFPADRSAREPWYDYDRTAPNVFDPSGPWVRWPNGGWDHEALIAQGGLVASTATLLRYLDAYRVNGDNIGARRTGSEGAGWRLYHTGSLPGTDTLARQRGDGINYVVLFNKRPSSGTRYSLQMRAILDEILDAGTVVWAP